VSGNRTARASRPGLARAIRILSVPIILLWLAALITLNVAVPQLEVVTRQNSVALSPQDAPAAIAAKPVRDIVAHSAPAAGLKVYVTGQAALVADTDEAGDPPPAHTERPQLTLDAPRSGIISSISENTARVAALGGRSADIATYRRQQMS
jgi:uncharacterized membrane protein YdfJ with MMPL/SSD domain